MQQHYTVVQKQTQEAPMKQSTHSHDKLPQDMYMKLAARRTQGRVQP